LARLAVTQTCAVPPDLWIMGSCSQLRVQKSSKHDEPTNTPHADHVVYAGYYSVKLQPSWLQQHAIKVLDQIHEVRLAGQACSSERIRLCKHTLKVSNNLNVSCLQLFQHPSTCWPRREARRHGLHKVSPTACGQARSPLGLDRVDVRPDVRLQTPQVNRIHRSL
jgi:hypothetical protein